jgi:thioredoxin 1
MPKNELDFTIQTVTGTTFSSVVLEGHGPIVVEFMSYGCSHCRAIEPILEQVAQMLESKEKIVRVNSAVEQGLAEQYEIRGTPTLIMFLDGAIVGRVEGPSPDLSSVLTAIRQPYEN